MGFAFYEAIPGTLIFVGLVPLLWIEEDMSRHQEQHRPVILLLVAWNTFLLWNLVVLWWAGKASIGAAAVVIVVNGLLYAVVFWLFHLAKRRFGPGFGYAALLFYWLAFEYFHSWWVLSMPWLKLGHALGNEPALMQWYDATGAAGGTAWIIMTNVMVFKVLYYWVHMRTAKGSLGNLLILLIVFLVPLSLSLNRDFRLQKGSNVQALVVQPNINPWEEKFDSTRQARDIGRFLELAGKNMHAETQLVIGPETLIANGFWESRPFENPHVQRLQHFVAENPQIGLLTGAMSFQQIEGQETLAPYARNPKKADEAFAAFNSAVWLRYQHNAGFYHKNRLLPGVETMPFPVFSSQLNKLMLDLGGVSGMLAPGKTQKVFRKDSIRVAPLICWESVFGNYTGRFVRSGANILAVLANDGWWDHTPGYNMHLMFSRIRAIEYRRFVLRAANTGISAIITPGGTIAGRIGWQQSGTLAQEVSLNSQQTYYARTGAFAGRTAMFFSLLLLLYTAVHYWLKDKL